MWVPLSSQQPNHYIWAPLSQEELCENNREASRDVSREASREVSRDVATANAKLKKLKKQDSTIHNSSENIVSDNTAEVNSNNGLSNGNDMEFDFSEADDQKGASNKGDQTQIRMLNVKIRALETALDKLNFEKSEVSQERDQLEKEIKADMQAMFDVRQLTYKY